ncbi:MAG: SH3 domain-containing protein [Chloroflexi bacterium]|nr:SH3 domain-containing protein [Chloroflexota bacterium]
MTSAQLRVLLILTGLVGAMVIATVIVFSSDRGNGEQTSTGGTVPGARPPGAIEITAIPRETSTRPAGTAGAAASSTAPATATPTMTPRDSASVRAGTAVNVRSGPGTDFPPISALQPGGTARVVGRNADASWLRIELAEGPGWVSAGVVEVTGELQSIPISDANATATPSPTATGTRTPTSTPTQTATVTRTPTPAASPSGATSANGLPDLVVQDAAIAAAGRLQIVIANTGSGPLTNRRVSIAGTDEAGGLLFSETTTAISIPANGALNIELTFRPTMAGTITVIVNGDNAVDELSASNNRRQIIVRPSP